MRRSRTMRVAKRIPKRYQKNKSLRRKTLRRNTKKRIRTGRKMKSRKMNRKVLRTKPLRKRNTRRRKNRRSIGLRFLGGNPQKLFIEGEERPISQTYKIPPKLVGLYITHNTYAPKYTITATAKNGEKIEEKRGNTAASTTFGHFHKAVLLGSIPVFPDMNKAERGWPQPTELAAIGSGSPNEETARAATTPDLSRAVYLTLGGETTELDFSYIVPEEYKDETESILIEMERKSCKISCYSKDKRWMFACEDHAKSLARRRQQELEQPVDAYNFASARHGARALYYNDIYKSEKLLCEADEFTY